MILYFSATGSCKYAAEKIAEAIGDTAESIEKTGTQITLAKNEIFGFVTPTYCWELPIIVREYLENLDLTASEDTYSFVLAAYGTTPGAAGADAAHILRKKNIAVTALYSLRMPDSWTPMFDLSNADRVKAQLARADEELQQIISDIENRKTGNRMHRSVPYPARYISDIWYKTIRKTKNFSVEEGCIGCGLCERNCPAHAIRMQNGKPAWIQESCIMCLRCLHHCPKFAIQYGRNTKRHGQYRHPGTKV